MLYIKPIKIKFFTSRENHEKSLKTLFTKIDFIKTYNKVE